MGFRLFYFELLMSCFYDLVLFVGWFVDDVCFDCLGYDDLVV